LTEKGSNRRGRQGFGLRVLAKKITGFSWKAYTIYRRIFQRKFSFRPKIILAENN